MTMFTLDRTGGGSRSFVTAAGSSEIFLCSYSYNGLSEKVLFFSLAHIPIMDRLKKSHF